MDRIEELQNQLYALTKERNSLKKQVKELELELGFVRRNSMNRELRNEDYSECEEISVKKNEKTKEDNPYYPNPGLEAHLPDKVLLKTKEGFCVIATRCDTRSCFKIENDIPLYYPITELELKQRGYEIQTDI